MIGASTPEDRRYLRTHEWAQEKEGILRVGITDHAQSELTDIVFVELPAVGKEVVAGGPLLVLESVKTVADVYAPATGSVSAVNEALRKNPGLVNQDPYGEGWILELRVAPSAARSELLDAAGYRASLLAP
ncbi:MAG: glycine cleavage system protein GcvH [Thermoplasmata archaeon]|nr:glycine cleavage system protein GcvH [Thermoplasmata archaeon]MCI4342089.1 glycine cleavage system protein GcvH [Thermoplasmata archaeon]